MNMDEISDRFLSIQDFKKTQIKVKGSRFIASAFPVSQKEKAKELIRKTEKEFHAATHNCFAYRIKTETEDIFRSSDAGEPNGTAGEPILSAIKSKELYNLLVVVTRYFGGVKLGKGGLSRAYHQAAMEALDKCRIVENFITQQLSIFFPLDLVGKVSQTLDKYNVKVLERKLQLEGFVKAEVRLGQSESFRKSLIEISSGQVRFEK